MLKLVMRKVNWSNKRPVLISVRGWWDVGRKSSSYGDQSSWNDWICISESCDSLWYLEVRNSWRIGKSLNPIAWLILTTLAFVALSIFRQTNSEEDEIKAHLTELQSKGLIKEMDNNAFTRVVQNERSVKVGFTRLIFSRLYLFQYVSILLTNIFLTNNS